jgi:hypothetical protein
MSDYKRFVSYLYSYENEKKKSNIGYARIERQNGQCKITLHIRLLSLSSATLQVYLFYREKERILGLPLCSISSDMVLDTSLPFSKMSGIIIPISSGRLLGTCWDDSYIVPSAFSPVETTQSAALVQPKKALSSAKQFDSQSVVDSVMAEPSLSATSTSPSVENIALSTEVSDDEPSLSSENTMSTEVPPASTFNTITNYLLIDTAYIDHFSTEYANLKQNSFLLHGYDSYRHLILAKWLLSTPVLAAEVTDEKEDTPVTDFDVFYQLGVPGIYSSTQIKIAEKFGFTEFKTTKTTPLKYGDFGYWMTEVTF